jgi:hypothetical protein
VLLCLAAWPAGATDYGPGSIGLITETTVGNHRVLGGTDIVFTPTSTTDNGVRVTGAGVNMEIDADVDPITIISNGSPAVSSSAVAVGGGAYLQAHGNYLMSNNNQGNAAPASAVAASGGGTIIDLVGGKVTHTKTNNDPAYDAALQASNGASINANNVTIEATHTSAANTGTNLTFGVGSAGSGSTITVTGGTITTSTPDGGNNGNRVYGASAETGGVVTLNGVDVFTGGSGVEGVGTRDHGVVPAGGTININGGSINVRGTPGSNTFGNVGGLYSAGANGTSIINAVGTQINSEAFGVFLQSNGSSFEINGLQQSNGGSNANNITQAHLCDSVINAGRPGLLATARNRTITASGVTITAAKGTTANEAGVYIVGGARVELSDTCSIGGTGGVNQINAVTGHGVHVSGTNSGVSSTFVASGSGADSTLINVAADNEYGVNITAGGTAELINTNIHTTGEDAYGVRLDGATSAAQLDSGNAITTQGPASHGFVVTNAANKTFDGSAGNVIPAIGVQGSGSAVLAAIGANLGAVATLTLNGVTLSNDGGAPHPGTIGVLSEGERASVTLTGATIGMAGADSFTALARASAINASGVTLNATTGAHGVRLENGGVFTATAGTKIEAPPGSDAFQFEGGANSAALDASEATGKANTVSGESELTLTGGSVWTMTGDSNLTTLNNDNSFVIYPQPTGSRQAQSSYKTLTLEHLNGNGGVIELHAWLASDGSPSDRLIIAPGGSVTGKTTLRLPPLDLTVSPGALTTGNGILMVDVPNNVTMLPGAFELETGPITINGHTYTLEQGGVGAPNSWFLRSGPIIPRPAAVPSLSGAMLTALALLLAGVAALRRRNRQA